MSEQEQEFPSLRHLRMFELLASGLSARAVADLLRVSQPAVSLSLSGLERRYGVPLAERHSRGLTLNHYGRVLQARADRALALIRRGIARSLNVDEVAGRDQIDRALALVTIPQMRALTTIVQHDSLKGASRRLGLRHSTVHHTLADLEAALGATVLHRDRRGNSANTTGREIAVLFNRAFKELEFSQRDIDEAQGIVDGRITLGAVPVTFSTIIPEAIAKITLEYPAVRFQVISEDHESMIDGLRSGRLDLMCSTGRAINAPGVASEFPSDIAAEVIFESELCLVARADHPLANRRDIPLAELAHYRWACSGPATGAAIRFRMLFEDAALAAPKITVETRLFQLIQQLVMNGDFLAVMTQPQARRTKVTGMVALDVTLPHLNRRVWLMSHHDWLPTRLHTRFMEEIRLASRQFSGLPNDRKILVDAM